MLMDMTVTNGILGGILGLLLGIALKISEIVDLLEKEASGRE